MVWWVRSDACGLFSASFTVVLILYAQFVIVKVVLLPWYGFSYHVILYTITSALALISHSRAQYSDPGAVPKTAVPLGMDGLSFKDGEVPPGGPRTCRKCKTVKPSKAHHCSTCARCIIRMDHHCPWVNNCVAIFNQKYFILFLFYTALACIYSAVLLVSRFISCTQHMRQCSVTGAYIVLCVINFIEALVFGLFVIIMMCDQVGAILDNTPQIDALQNKHGTKKTKYQSFKDVFGESLSWRWFLPLNLTAKVSQDFAEEMRLIEDTSNNQFHTLPPSSDHHIALHSTNNNIHHRDVNNTTGGAAGNGLMAENMYTGGVG